MVMGFMAGVALGQQLVGMKKSTSMTSTTQRMRSAKLAAFQRMQAHQRALVAAESAVVDNLGEELQNDASGRLLNSIRNGINELNSWIKRQTAGILDLNISMAIMFAIRGIRKFLIEKQYPSAWQLIWWATSILRGWRFA